MATRLKAVLMNELDALEQLPVDELLKQRYQRLRSYGAVSYTHLDVYKRQLWDRVDALLAKNRPGTTPLRLDLLVDSGERRVGGVLDLNGPKSIRVDAELVDALRAHPGVRTVKLAISRPWAN